MKNTAAKPPIIRLQNVSKRFIKSLDVAAKIAQKLGANIREEVVHAVDNVSLSIAQGEVVGLAGESGCGKSTLGRMVAGILPLSEGTILYKGKDVAQLPPEEFKQFSLNIQMIFQDPFASLNPRKRVRNIIGNAPLVHGIAKRSELDEYLDKVMLRCGLDPTFKRRSPHQFSGGQRQRIGIARALAVNPEFIVCDEAVAALDVSIQSQILNLLADLQEQFQLTYLFIAHDLNVVEHLSDRVAVMYLGKIVEIAPSIALYKAPLHPYTQALLSAVPIPNPAIQRVGRIILKGDVPSPIDPPPGCSFHPRCLFARDVCSKREPEFREIQDKHFVACFFAGQLSLDK